MTDLDDKTMDELIEGMLRLAFPGKDEMIAKTMGEFRRLNKAEQAATGLWMIEQIVGMPWQEYYVKAKVELNRKKLGALIRAHETVH